MRTEVPRGGGAWRPEKLVLVFRITCRVLSGSVRFCPVLSGFVMVFWGARMRHAPTAESGDGNVAGTGRLESVPYGSWYCPVPFQFWPPISRAAGLGDAAQA